MTTLTRWGHSCVRIEADGRALTVDPGAFSQVGPALDGVAAVLVTHEHPDHVDLDAVVGAAAAGADVVAPEPVVAQLAGRGAAAERLRVGTPGERLTVAGFTVDVLGGEHAVIHPDAPVVANLAYLVDGVVLHPGDSWTLPPADVRVDVLLVPLGAPWLRVGDVVDHVRAVRPQRLVAVHDAGLSDLGVNLAVDLVGRLGGAGPVTVLGPGESVELLHPDAVPVIEADQTAPPRPEDEVADAARTEPDPAGHGPAS